MTTAYERWTAEVDRILLRRLGVGILDLPDLTDLGGLYASEVTPTDAANCVILDHTGKD